MDWLKGGSGKGRAVEANLKESPVAACGPAQHLPAHRLLHWGEPSGVGS